MEMPEPTEARNWEGSTVVDRDGEHLGRCTGVYADVDTGATEWLTVDVQGHRRSFIPALDATEDDGTVRVRFPRTDVLSAPQVGDDQELSKGDEVRLYDHYGVKHTSAASGSVLPTGAPQEEPAPSAAGSSPIDEPTAAIPAPDPLTSSLAGSPLPSSTQSVGTPSSDRLDRDDDAPVEVVDAPPVIADAPPVVEEPVAEPVVEEPEPVVVSAPEPVVEPEPEPVVAPAAARPSVPLTAPRPQPSGSSPSAVAPLAVVAGVIAVASVVLRLLERRSRRKQRPAARAARAGKQLKDGSGAALRSASQQLSLVPDVASRTAAQLASAAAVAGDAAAQKGSALGQTVATKSSSASKTVSSKGSAASRTVSAKSKKAAKKSRKAAKKGSGVGQTVAAIPPAVAKKGRRARRSAAGAMWDVATVGSAGTGYVLGAKAGHERYEQINQQASELAASPQVQAISEVITDPARREQVLTPVKEATSTLASRLPSSKA